MNKDIKDLPISGCIWGLNESIAISIPHYLYDNLSEFYKQNKLLIINDLKLNRYKYNILIDLDFFYIFDYIFTTDRDILGKEAKNWNMVYLDHYFYIYTRPLINEAFWNLIFLIINNFFFFFNKKNYLLCSYFKSNFQYFFKSYKINLKFSKLKKIKIKNLNFKTINYSFLHTFNPIIIYKKNFNTILMTISIYQYIGYYNYNIKIILLKLIKLEIDKNFIFFIYIIFYLNSSKIININNLKLTKKDYKILKILFSIKTINFYNFDKKKLKKLNLKKLMLLLINLPEFKNLRIIGFNLKSFITVLNIINNS